MTPAERDCAPVRLMAPPGLDSQRAQLARADEELRRRCDVLREFRRRPGPGYREVLLDGEPHGWVPPTWTMPDHRCITLRDARGYQRAYVESWNAGEVRVRLWTDADTAEFQRARKAAKR